MKDKSTAKERAEGLIKFFKSDFGQSGPPVPLEAIKCEIEAAEDQRESEVKEEHLKDQAVDWKFVAHVEAEGNQMHHELCERWRPIVEAAERHYQNPWHPLKSRTRCGICRAIADLHTTKEEKE